MSPALFLFSLAALGQRPRLADPASQVVGGTTRATLDQRWVGALRVQPDPKCPPVIRGQPSARARDLFSGASVPQEAPKPATGQIGNGKPPEVDVKQESVPLATQVIEFGEIANPLQSLSAAQSALPTGPATTTAGPADDSARLPAATLPSGAAFQAPTSEQVLSILSYAESRRIAMREAAVQDSTAAATPYQSMTIPQIAERIDTAVQSLSPVVETLREAAADPRVTRQIARVAPQAGGQSQAQTVPQRLDASDIARFANLYQNALDKAEAAQGALKIQLNDVKVADAQRAVTFLPSTPGALLGMPPALTAINPLARTPELANLFPFPDDPKTPPSRVASSNDGLVDRIVMFNGLPESERAKILPNLQFVERAQFKTRSGKTAAIPILHNGYIFGKMDCSSFVSQVLFGDARSTRLTTMDFKGIWFLLLNGRLPLPPEWEADRAKVIRELSKGFAPVSLDRGEQLLPGDLLVFRHPKVAWGHVFLVRSYDPGRHLARVMEASQSAGTLRERDFYTVFGVKGEDTLYYIPGLFGLRLKGSQNNVCTAAKGGGA